MKREKELDVLPMIKNNYNAKKFPTNYEKNGMPSETVPDQTMSISEIMKRFAKGLPLGGAKVELYEGEEDLYDGINPKTLDLAEHQEIQERAQQELTDIQRRHQNKLFKKQQKSLEREIEKKIIEQQKNQTGEEQNIIDSQQ